MKQLAFGVVLAALAMFVWGFLFWGVPWPNPAYSHLSEADEAALWETVRDHVPETGVYYLPDVQREGTMEAAVARHRQGPLAKVMVHAEGAEVMSAGVFIGGFLHMLVSAFLLALLLRGAAPVLGSYGRRVAFVVLAGLAVAVWANLGEPIWNYHPWTHELTNAVYDWTSCIVAGLVLARFVRQPVEGYAR